MGNLKILLVDDQILFAESLMTFFKNYADDMEVVGIYSDVQNAYDFFRENTADIVLMDVRIPMTDGMESVRKIKADFPNVKIIMLSTHDEYVREALSAGASGYLLKDISPTELIVSIRALNSGIMQISPAIMHKLMQQTYVRNESDTLNVAELQNFKWLKTLTNREREIFALLVVGKTNEQITRELGLALQTVRNQVSTIYSKLGVKDRFEIIQRANKIK